MLIGNTFYERSGDRVFCDLTAQGVDCGLGSIPARFVMIQFCDHWFSHNKSDIIEYTDTYLNKLI